MSSESVFSTLSAIEVRNKVRQKGDFWYVSWANAVRELLKAYPLANWEFTRFDGLPYLKTEAGCFVECSVTVNELTRTQMLPVLDFRNRPVHEPDSTQINKSQQRALTKAIALHGFGLELWAGEDLDKQELDSECVKATSKSAITNERLEKAILKIKAGEYSVERLRADFDLTDDQQDIVADSGVLA